MSSLSKMLVVNHDLVLLGATRAALESVGYETLQVSNYDDALAVAQEHRPDLVLLDVNPDKLGGFETCRRIKTDRLLAGTTLVVILSSVFTDTDSRAQGLELGADDYLLRPIANRELLTRVRALVRGQAVERALQASESRFRALVENSSDAITLLDAKGVAVYDSPAAPGMLGYTPQDWIGQNVFSLIHPDDLPQSQDLFQNLVKTPGARVESTFRVRHKSGAWLWIEMVATNLLFKPDVNAIVLNYRDISVRKQAENALRESEDKFKYDFDHSVLGKSITLVSGEINVNQAFCDMLGYSPEELKKRNWHEISHPDDLELSETEIGALLSGQKESTRFIKRYLHKNGSIIWAEVGTALRCDADGSPLYFLTSIIDITARKQAEETLRESEERFATIFRANPAPIAITRLEDDQLVDVNQAWQAVTGYGHAEAVGYTDVDLNLWANPEQRANLVGIARERGLALGEIQLRHRSGQIHNLLFSTEQITLSDKHYLLTMAQDITERKQMEDALRTSEAFSRAILQNSPIGISIRSQTGKLISANEAWKKIWAIPEADFLADQETERQTLNFNTRDGYLAPHLDAVQRVYQQGEHLYLPELKINNPRPGAAEWIAQHFYAIQDEHGQVQRVVILTEDITERKRAEEALNETKHLFQLLIESLPQNIYAKDVNGRFVFANQRYCATQGKTPEEIMGKTDFDLHPPEMAEKYRTDDRLVIETEKAIELEEEHQPMQGRKSIVQVIKTPFYDFKGQTAGTLGIFWDITERKQAEETLKEYNARLESAVEARTRELQDAQEQLVLQEKLAVLGQLAGGVGHELRNPLGIINNAIYYLRLVQPEANETVQEYLGIIETETHNADKIISDLLDFSRVKSVDVEPVAVSELARRTLERFPVPQNVQVALDMPKELPILYVDPRQLIQVLGNLVLNACQAMPQGGTLSLSAKKKGKMVALAVADTGAGITPEAMQKLFEPLFTTKPKGIGLGLAVSKKLVEANNGKVEVKSQPGKGAIFTVYLPVTK